MGKVYAKLFAKKPVRMIIMGLDAAGKTTMLYQMKLGEVVTTIPTIGFNVETFKYKNIHINAFDVGGRDKIRPLLRHYYPNTDAVMWIIDSADVERLDEVRDEVKRMASEDDLRGVPLLFIANKQDLVNAVSLQTLVERLELMMLPKESVWSICGTSALKGEGIYEGLDWLTNQIGQNKAWKNVEEVQTKAANTVNENKAVKNSWEYTVSGLNILKSWLCGNKKEQTNFSTPVY